MLFAQEIPAPPPAQLGVWLFCFGCLLGIAWVARQLYLSFFPPPPVLKDEERFVTHGHLDTVLTNIRAEFSTLKSETRETIDRANKDFSSRVQRLDDYLHESMHRIADAQNKTGFDVAYVRGLLERSPLPDKDTGWRTGRPHLHDAPPDDEPPEKPA